MTDKLSYFGIILKWDYLFKPDCFLTVTAMTKSTYTDNYAKLIKQLVDCRKKQKMTQTELSACMGKPQSFIAKIENRERRLDVIEFLELCKHMQIDPIPIVASLIVN